MTDKIRMYGLDSPQAEDYSNANWMVIFSDLMSLCLTFFILLFSMSDTGIDAVRINKHSPDVSINSKSMPESSEPTSVYGQELNYLYTVSKEKLSAYPSSKQITLQKQDDKLLFILPDEFVFEAGSEKILPEANELVYDIAEIVKSFRNQIIVVGWASNWKMALGKANNVVEMIKGGDFNQKITATSDISEHPVFKNNIVIEIIASTPSAVAN